MFAMSLLRIGGVGSCRPTVASCHSRPYRNTRLAQTARRFLCGHPQREQNSRRLAGIWTNWTSLRKAKEGEIAADVFAFLTKEPNAIVAPIHPKAKPVILKTEEEFDIWLLAPENEAITIQRPRTGGVLKIVAKEAPQDGVAELIERA